jgi:Co/Zn/Cd efflux system component
VSRDRDSHRDHAHEDEHSQGGHSHRAAAHEHTEEQKGHSHGHDHGGGSHGHTHGPIDPTILTTERGVWAVKWSFAGLFITAVIQLGVVVLSSSIALFADTIHNFGDAATALPLAIAFSLGRRKPTKRFTYGYGRVEDLAGVAVVLTILASAIVVGYESIRRFRHPQPVGFL